MLRQGTKSLSLARWFTSTTSTASIAGWSLPSSRSLWDILKREHIEKLDATHIADIWSEFHRDVTKHRVASVLTGAQFLKFQAIAEENPMFVLPIFRGPNAFETFTLQCQLPYVLFTSLEEMKRNGSAAAPHFVLTHYSELINSKGIVLVRGDILQPGSLDALQASSLSAHCHQFYTDLNGAKAGFVRAFNHRQHEFDFKRMLDSLGHDTSKLYGT